MTSYAIAMPDKFLIFKIYFMLFCLQSNSGTKPATLLKLAISPTLIFVASLLQGTLQFFIF